MSENLLSFGLIIQVKKIVGALPCSDGYGVPWGSRFGHYRSTTPVLCGAGYDNFHFGRVH